MDKFYNHAFQGRNKYGNKRVGSHASKKEHYRAGELRMMQRAGLISDLREQVSYLLNGADSADKWFKAKLVFITVDEKSSKEKKTTTHFIVSASDINNAHFCVVEHMKGSVMDFEIATLDETKIMDIFRYKPNTANG